MAHFAKLIGVTPYILKNMISAARLRADALDERGRFLFRLSDIDIKEAKEQAHKYRSRSPEL